MFHAHKAGKKMRTRIIRDGIELPWLAVDNHYDFNYQASRPFQEYRKVLPGDHIITGKCGHRIWCQHFGKCENKDPIAHVIFIFSKSLFFFISVECTYDTSTRSNVTIGGRPSMYEM